jgi:hypothetical protein
MRPRAESDRRWGERSAKGRTLPRSLFSREEVGLSEDGCLVALETGSVVRAKLLSSIVHGLPSDTEPLNVNMKNAVVQQRLRGD